MLSNSYPSIAECAKIVREGVRQSYAFHKDFAVSFSPLHDDYALEFRGKKIGITADLVGFKLMPDHEYLRETLQEVLQKEKAYGN
jgi:hypothetical protein